MRTQAQPAGPPPPRRALRLPPTPRALLAHLGMRRRYGALLCVWIKFHQKLSVDVPSIRWRATVFSAPLSSTPANWPMLKTAFSA